MRGMHRGYLGRGNPALPDLHHDARGEMEIETMKINGRPIGEVNNKFARFTFYQVALKGGPHDGYPSIVGNSTIAGAEGTDMNLILKATMSILHRVKINHKRKENYAYRNWNVSSPADV